MYIKYLIFCTLKKWCHSLGAISGRSKANFKEMIMKLDLMKGLCSLPLPHSAVGWSVVCDCGISWSSDRY